MDELQEFDPEKRDTQITWLIEYIKMMIQSGVERQNTNIIIYACFETRNLLEKIEFDLVQAAMTTEEREEYFDLMAKMDGSNKAFGKLEDSFHHYFTYLKALCEANEFPHPSNYDAKIARRFKTELNDYCHLYSKTQSDFIYGSQYTRDGITLVNNILTYLKESDFIKKDGRVTIIGTVASQLEKKGDGLYLKWKNKEISYEELVKALKHKKEQ